MAEAVGTGKFVLEGDFKKVVAELEKLTRKIGDMEGGLKKTKAESKDLEKAFSGITDIRRDLAGMVAGWVSIGGAIQLATAAVQKYRQEQEAARKAGEARAGAIQQGVAFAKTPEEFRQLNRLVAAAA
jgi:hypothetical protein